MRSVIGRRASGKSSRALYPLPRTRQERIARAPIVRSLLKRWGLAGPAPRRLLARCALLRAPRHGPARSCWLARGRAAFRPDLHRALGGQSRTTASSRRDPEAERASACGHRRASAPQEHPIRCSAQGAVSRRQASDRAHVPPDGAPGVQGGSGSRWRRPRPHACPPLQDGAGSGSAERYEADSTPRPRWLDRRPRVFSKPSFTRAGEYPEAHPLKGAAS